MSEIQSRLANLSPDKLKLLRQRLRRQDRQTPALPTLVPAPEDRYRPFPLTDVQQAYWIGRQGFFELGNVASHAYVEMDFPELDVRRLERALDQLIGRHEMLRAVVLADGRQQILPSVPPYRIAVLDLAGVAAERTDRALRQLRKRMSHQVLPADRWPLFEMRATLLPGGRALLHLSFDILIGDLWSFQILRRELGLFYLEPETELEPLELSFRDYVLAESRFESSAAYRRSQAYWRQRLRDLPPAPELPLARSPGALERPRFARRRGAVPAARWRRLKARAVDRGLTPSSLLLAIYAEILALWSRSPRFTLNVTTFNRLPVHPQINQVVGDFTSLTLVSIDNAAGDRFGERAEAVRRQLWRDLEHGQVSAIRLLRQMQSGDGPAVGMPVVFTSMLFEEGGAEPSAASAREEADAGREAFGGDGQDHGISQTPQTWLDFQISEDRGALRYNWDAVEDLFPAGLLDDMFAALGAVLAQLDDDRAWSRRTFDLLPEEQLRRRRRVNATAAEPPAELLHHGFEEQARAHPERTAVIAADRRLTYGELEGLANRLAAELRRAGAAPDRLVAVLAAKGWEQVAAVLGVLKAGAAYLPIDPELPAERIRHLLGQGEVSIVLTGPGGADRRLLPAAVERVLPVIWEEPAAGGAEPPPEPVQGLDHLAYVIFTSGSTGQPKGVMIDHRGAVNTVLDVNRRFGVGPGDAVLALSSLSFDLSVWDLFGVLGAGGRVVIPEATAVRSPARWIELVAEHRVTIWSSVPALVEMLVDEAESRPDGGLEPLRLVMMSGDWIPVRLPDRIRALAPAAERYSLGGATEASIWSILYPIGEVPPEWTSIPYGQPMDNQTFHVLDHRLAPRPDWVPGELHIGGVGLARGYWRDPEKTRAAFLEIPGGERLYRTGDLGRYLPSGDVEILGREDLQVKVQGYRIELGEIEAALEQHPAVRAGVVVALGEKRGAKSLVACVVPEGEAPPAAGGDGEPAAAPAAEVDWLAGGDGERRLALPPARPRHPVPAPRRPLGGTVPRGAVEELLSALMRIRIEGEPLPKYRYASAGTLYPVQSYLAVRSGRVAGLDGGLYYHHPEKHVLVALSDAIEAAESDRALTAALAPSGLAPELAEDAPFALFLVGKLDAIEPIYQRWSRAFCLLEAGYMGQLLAETAAASELALEPAVAVELGELRRRLDLDDRHLLLHTLVGAAAASGEERAAAAPAVADPAAGTPVAGTPVLGAEPVAPGVPPLEGQIPQLEFKLDDPGLRRGDRGRPRIALPAPADDDRLRGRYRRRSHRRFAPRPLAAGELGDLLARAHDDELSRRWGAGDGWRLDSYLEVKAGRVEGVPAAIYRYDPQRHQLVLCSEGEGLDRRLHAPVNREIYDHAAVSIFLTARPPVADADAAGRWSQDLAALAAGYRGQLLMEAAVGTGVGLCPIGTFELEPVRRLFGFGESEVVVHSLLAGAVEEAERPAAAEPGGEREERRHAFERSLRDFLAGKLPAYMIPTRFTLVERLPLTANGKVDRRSLAERLASPEREERAAYAAPRTDLERAITEIWARVLGVDRVGMNDNFYDLGGHSVAMVQIHRQLQERLERQLVITDLFRCPTPRALTTLLERRAGEDDEAGGRDLDRGRRRRTARRRRRRDSEPRDGEVTD